MKNETITIIEYLPFVFGCVMVFVGVIGGGVELKEVKIPTVDNRTRSLSIVVGVILIALGLWLKQSHLQEAPSDGHQPVSNSLEITPSASGDQKSKEQLAKDKEAIQSSLLAYAAAVSRHDISSALASWREPTTEVRNLIETTDFLTIQPTNTIYNGGRHAVVEANMVERSKEAEPQQYQGSVEMERTESGLWVIASTEGMRCTAGCDEVTADESGEPGEVVEEPLPSQPGKPQENP